MTAPRIRIGFLGASASPTAWANSTHIAYLLSAAGQSKYSLVALCNSSLASGHAAVAALGLPSTTKVYDSASALAADPSVDLVVCSVNVAKHYELIKPALLAGKMAFVEWPLGANISEAEELARIAEEKGVRTVVGLQGRMDPLIDIIRNTVDSGKIGEVLSSSISCVISWFPGPGLQIPERLAYLLDTKTGGNLTTIVFGHLIDIVQLSLSELTQFQSLLANQRKTVDILNDKKEIVKHAVEKDTADHIFLHGFHASGAASSLSIRFGENLEPTEPTLKWNIVGSQGQIEVTSTSILNLSLGTKIRVKGADGDIEEIDAQDGGKGPLANVERVYEAFARGDNRVASFADAVKLHRLLEQVHGGNLGQSAIFVSRT